MPTPPFELTPEIIADLGQLTDEESGAKYGRSPTTIRHWRAKAQRLGLMPPRFRPGVPREKQPIHATPHVVDSSPPPVLKSEIESTGDTMRVHVAKTLIHTEAELLREFDVDTNIWHVDRFTCKAYAAAAKNADGELEAAQLYSVTGYLKRNKQADRLVGLVDALVERISTRAPVYAPVRRTQRDSGLMWEVSPLDTHLGKLAYSRETGGDNYDLKIATETFEAAMLALLDRTSQYQFDEIVLVLGHDFYNCDSPAGMTTGGTPQDMDTRYVKVFETGFWLCVRTIEQMRLRSPRVVVKMVPGNHDSTSIFTLGIALAAYFRNCPEIVVDNEPTLTKYHRFGKVLLGFTHGDKGKKVDYPILMAQDCRKDFAECDWHEVHVGHLHHVQAMEYVGVRVRVLPSLSATDFWHATSGYRHAVRSCESYIWSGVEGLIGTANYNVPITS